MKTGSEKLTVILLVTVDTECDKDPNWNVRYPLSFQSVVFAIPKLLMPLFRKYEIIPTFLLSPEVLQHNESVKILANLSNCELGTHLHGEFIPPKDEPGVARTDTPQVAYSPDLEFEKLRNLTELFTSRFGQPPRSFRAGRFGMSFHTAHFLESLGYMVDSSVTPFRVHHFAQGFQVNFWGAPLTPYWLSRGDPRLTGEIDVLEAPVSLIISRAIYWPKFILRIIGNSATLRRAFKRRYGKPRWLRPLRGSPRDLIYTAEIIIHTWNKHNYPVLNIMFHSNELIPQASPYTKTSSDVRYLLTSLDILFQYLKDNYNVISIALSNIVNFYPRK